MFSLAEICLITTAISCLILLSRGFPILKFNSADLNAAVVFLFLCFFFSSLLTINYCDMSDALFFEMFYGYANVSLKCVYIFIYTNQNVNKKCKEMFVNQNDTFSNVFSSL